MHVELGVQVRTFLASNIAVSASTGLSLLAADGDGFVIDAQLLGAFGLSYFFAD